MAVGPSSIPSSSIPSVERAEPQAHDARAQAWGVVGILAQLAFLAGMFIPIAWQGPRYSAVQNTISDMEAVTAPHVWFALACFALGGVGTFAFAIFGLRPALAAAGKVAAYAPWLLACSVLALGSPFPQVPCRLVDPGCSLQVQLSSAGGVLEALLSGLGFFLLVLTPIPLGRRLAVLPFWRGLTPVMRVARILSLAVFVAFCVATTVGIAQGFLERLLATICIAWVAALAGGLIVFTYRSHASAS